MTIRRTSRQEQIDQGQIEILDALYGAVGNPERWSEVVRAAHDVFGGAVSLIWRPTVTADSQRLLATILDAAEAKRYEEHFGAVNPWAIALQGNRPALHVNDGNLLPEVVEKSEFYNDWLRHLEDLRYSFNLCVQGSSGDFFEFATVRPRGMGPISQEEISVLNGLIPHFRRAMELSRRLEIAETTRAASIAAARRTGAAVLLVDSNRRVVAMDSDVEIILGKGGLAIRNNQLRAPASMDEALGRAITTATGAGRLVAGRTGTLLAVPRPDGLAPLSVAVSPVDERDRPLGVTGPLAMVLMTDPERAGGPSEEGLRALFDLTSAEAKLVVALCAGETLASYAEATGTSLNTAKTHLKHVFDKTGETRQADLVRRVTNDLALRFAEPRSL